MEYAQPFVGPVLLVYAVLGAIIAVARLKVESGEWAEVHAVHRDSRLPGEASLTVKAALDAHGVSCRLRATSAQLASGETEPVTAVFVRPHQAGDARRILQELNAAS